MHVSILMGIMQGVVLCKRRNLLWSRLKSSVPIRIPNTSLRKQSGFTQVFKNEFWYLYTHGKGPSKIFRELGYDPETLGQYRISNFAYKLTKKMEERTNLSPLERERDLQSQVDALRFEIDSLKKIIIRDDIEKRKR